MKGKSLILNIIEKNVPISIISIIIIVIKKKKCKMERDGKKQIKFNFRSRVPSFLPIVVVVEIEEKRIFQRI